MKVVILDEMNIARVEYYFAEMLSLLEMPREDERYFSVVSSEADNDPIKMKEGKVWIPSNVWYVGTINNDLGIVSVKWYYFSFTTINSFSIIIIGW